MNPRPSCAKLLLAIFLFVSLGLLLAKLNSQVSEAQGGSVQVGAADPASAAQGTLNLSVKVTGKGFKNGAKAKWFVTGTSDPGGVTVNSTTFVSSSEVTANITVDDAAAISNFDIQVTNSDGRGGKGTELFAVISKNALNCPPQSPPLTSDTKCYAAFPGCLDQTFGSIGFVNIDPDNNGADERTLNSGGVAVQPDGKIVVFGSGYFSATGLDLAVIRYNSNGTLDTSFGDPDPLNPPLRRGYTVTAVSTQNDLPKTLALQSDGKIVVTSIGAGFKIIRYNVNGVLDSTFGSGGIVTFSGPVNDIALQANGKIITGGAGAGGFNLARLNTNGTLDSTFGSGGYVSANPGAKRGSSEAWGLAIQRVPAVTGEERVVLVGKSQTASNDASGWTLMRFRSTGAIDTTFGSSGIAKTAFFGFDDGARKVRIDPLNRIVVAGLVHSASTECGSYVTDFAVVRYTQDGNIDGSFSGGSQVVDIYGASDNLFDLLLQPDGKILLFGFSTNISAIRPHSTLVRFNSDGSRDLSFGILGNGIVATNNYDYHNYGYALALQPSDGKIVTVGSAYVDVTFKQGVIFVARYWQ